MLGNDDQGGTDYGEIQDTKQEMVRDILALTIDQAKQLRRGDILHETGATNEDDTCRRWRVNGQVKLWKRDVNRIQVPLSHGMYDHGYLTERNLCEFHTEGSCSAK